MGNEYATAFEIPFIIEEKLVLRGVNLGKVGRELEEGALIWEAELVFELMWQEGSASVFTCLVVSHAALTIDSSMRLISSIHASSFLLLSPAFSR
jgi:hypothetical protein